MGIEKSLARLLIERCGLKKLHGGAIQKAIRSFLDEIDLQNFREVHSCISVESREEMFRLANNACPSTESITYLEFGVYTGESMKEWTRINKKSTSRFYGFDSFEGLPEDWNEEKRKGHFNVASTIPEISDDRVTFIQGWFETTVPSFAASFKPEGRLIIHLDADLYSSTLLPLVYLDRFITSGTILIFDEFYDREHEFKALMDYHRIARKSFRAICHIDRFSKVCLEIL